MFGTNPLSKPLESDGQWLEVQSIFSTIQGEGPFAGQPAIFLRLAGCNLRCFFCDTDFESKRQTVSLGMIRARIEALAISGKKRRTSLVVVTGGEPLLQEVVPLCHLLTTLGYHVQFETAGTVWCDGLSELIKTGKVSIVCSPKAGKVHEMIETWCQHWKYLIREGEVSDVDGLPIKSTQIPGKDQKLFRPSRATDTVWLQPCEEYNVILETKRPFSVLPMPKQEGGDLSDQRVTEAYRNEEASRRNVRLCAELAMKFNYRISLQLHKLLQLP